MRTSLTHLPESKCKAIDCIVKIIREDVERAAGYSTHRNPTQIIKIILFGSHATGKWVRDPINGYFSDYDILVILDQSKLLEEYKVWDGIEDRVGLKMDFQLNIIVHTLAEVNHRLSQGHYFFTDIKNEGILLYELPKSSELAVAGNLSPAEAKAVAQEHYEEWFESAGEFFDTFYDDLKKKRYKKAAFELHQATERFYSCLLLVLTNYKPNGHSLKLLNGLAIEQDRRVADIFPQTTKKERRCFELLKDAYVKARYSKHYTITQDELAWLGERVKQLQHLTKVLCQKKINRFAG